MPDGVVYYVPILDAAGTVVDFRFIYLNPAAQRILALPSSPTTTYLGQWPSAAKTGAFDFLRDTFLSDAPAHRDEFYRADGYDLFLRVQARRLEEGLLLTFTDGNDQPRTTVEQALRESQAREQAARAEAELHRGELQRVFELAPVAIAVYRGPSNLVELANTTTYEIWGLPYKQGLGQPLLDVLPELVGQGFDTLLDQVRTTEEPYRGYGMPSHLQRNGRTETVYWDFIYLPMYDAEGKANGVLTVASDVTAQVLARQQIEEKERQTNLLNEELRAANEEILANNAAMERAQTELRQLNEQLEARVAERTKELHHAQTSEQQARQRAEAQQQVLTNVFEQAPFAVILLRGPEYVVELINEPSAVILGTIREKIQGRPIFEALPTLRGQGLEDVYAQVYQGETVVFEELPLLFDRHHASDLPDQGYVRAAYLPWRDAHGEIMGVMGVGYEVTAQVLARQQVQALNENLTVALQETKLQREQLRVLTDALPVLIGYLDRERRYQFANEAYRAWFNRDPAALLGQHVQEVVGEAAYATTSRYMDRALAGERLHFESRMVYREDFIKYIHTDYIPDERDGEVRGFYTLVTDITEQALARHQMENSQLQVQALNEELAAINEELTSTNEDLNESNARLTRTNADLDNFIYTASHDLKAPITNIEGLLRLLEDVLPDTWRTDPVLAPVLTHMQESVERFTRTIAHLTEVSKLQLEFDHPATSTALAPILHDVRQDLQPLFAETGGQMTIDVYECPTLVMSEKNLRSVLYNLVSNALKYYRPGHAPQVHISCTLEDDRRVLRVQDFGLGLAKAQQVKLFQLFQRLHTHVEGTGVGLYMVKKMVENAGGTITVQSREGEGSTFTLSFPA